MIGKVVYNRLTADSNITSYVGLKVFPDIAPQDVKYPFIVYTIISSTPVNFKDGQSNLEEIDLQLDIYSDNYDTCQTLTNDVRNNLDRFTGTVENVDVQTITYKSADSNIYNPNINVYWISIDFMAKIKR